MAIRTAVLILLLALCACAAKHPVPAPRVVDIDIAARCVKSVVLHGCDFSRPPKCKSNTIRYTGTECETLVVK